MDNVLIQMRVEWKQSVDVQDVIRRVYPYLQPDQLTKYTKQTGKVWQIFQKIHKANATLVIKNHQQIQDFILTINLKYKTKLQFGSFMLKGVPEISLHPELNQSLQYIAFFDISQSSIGSIFNIKLLKKAGGRYNGDCCYRLPWQWKERQVSIIKTGILYFSKSKIKEYLPFGRNFKVYKGKQETDYAYSIRIEVNHRKLLLYASDSTNFFKFLFAIDNTQAVLDIQKNNRFNSFSPIRLQNRVDFLVDGQRYFKQLFEGIERAQQQIMICNWFISPFFQLLRPVSTHQHARFDYTLKRAAQRGVHIFILLYNESSFLTNDSDHAKHQLQAISPMIKVLRHPLGILPTFWSHHQKVLIVDQCEAFMGGLDIGYGRWDTHEHLIGNNDQDYYPGLEYNNMRVIDLQNVRDYHKSGVERHVARLPWHDVALHLAGQSVIDLCHHFIQYWNYASFQTHYEDRYILILNPKDTFIKKLTKKMTTIKDYAGELKNKLFSQNKQQGKKEGLQKEKVYIDKIETKQIDMNFLKVDFKPFSSQSTENYREDKQEVKLSDLNSERMVSQTEERLQMAKSDRRLKHSYPSMNQLDAIVQTMNNHIEPQQQIDNFYLQNKKTNLQQIEDMKQYFECQVVRSVGSWSIGCSPQNTERSIHTAYLQMIRESKRFIYIENQFFVCATQGCSTVKNQIAKQICERILRAHEKGEHFKVIVVTPLIPGFAGQLNDQGAIIPRIIMHWQYNGINRHNNSLFSRLYQQGINPSKYIKFFGLRTHGIVNQHPQTEIVYVHSKLMIVDDIKAICGSANINDRSMRGSRDSQLCLVIEGPKDKTITDQHGAEVQVCEKILNLRVDLFRQHFGGDFKYEVIGDKVWEEMIGRAELNTYHYRSIFHCYPDDNIHTIKDLELEMSKKTNQQLYYKHKDEIMGYAVEFPLRFMENEDLLKGSTIYPHSLSI